MKQLTDDLKMATINLASVPDVEKIVNEAETALKNYQLNQANRRMLVETLEKIKDTKAYELTPDMVEEIDTVLNEVSSVIIDENGNSNLVTFTGTESFGLTLLPSIWLSSRISGIESLLDDIAKNLKRWANQLTGKINELWTSNYYAVESLKKKIVTLDGKLAALEKASITKDKIIIPATVNKFLSVNNKSILGNDYIEETLSTEVNFIFNVIKVWTVETVAYKNKVIRYFGNKAKGPVRELRRIHPPFFSKRWYVDDDDMNYVYFTTTKRFIGSGCISFCEYTKPIDDLTKMAKILNGSKYQFVQAGDTSFTTFQDTTLSPLKFEQLESIYNTIAKTVDIIEGLNDKKGSFNISDKDVKDVLGTLKALDDTEILDAYATITTHYQFDVSGTQTNFIKYLYLLCEMLIAFTNINLEAYGE